MQQEPMVLQRDADALGIDFTSAEYDGAPSSTDEAATSDEASAMMGEGGDHE